jgi:hypothetical protein
MKQLSTLLLIILCTQAQAKIWRINNNAGIAADFTSFGDAVNSASVVAGDTLHLEPSNTEYATSSVTITKRLVVLGVGYLLDPADATTTGNTGLQTTTLRSALQFFRVANGANGSKFAGLSLSTFNILGGAASLNITIERCYIYSAINFENGNTDGLTVKKCFFNNGNITTGGSATATNFTCENNIFYNPFSYLNLPGLTGSANIIRNNSFYETSVGNTIVNAYIANNIFGVNTPTTFTNCTIKNNLFRFASQTLPGTATGNQIGIDQTAIYVGGTTGGLDTRVQLKAGSPALGAGLTVGTVTAPDCGAYGATDPYKLSGIPAIPSIYGLTVPTSIPSGSSTMNITFSTRNNN